MCPVEWRYFQWPWVTPNYLNPPYFRYFQSPFVFSWCVEWHISNLARRLTVASDKSSLKWAWSDHVNQFNFGGHQPYLWNGWNYSGKILYTSRLCQVPAYCWQMSDHKKGHGQGYVTHFTFWGPNDIYGMVEARIVRILHICRKNNPSLWMTNHP